MVRRFIAAALALALALPLGWGASPAAAGERMRKWWNSPRMVSELRLTPAEKRRLDELYLDFQRRLIEIKGETQKARLEIEAAFAAKPLDEARARAAFSRVEQAKQARGRAVRDFVLAVRRLLGRDRYQRLKSLYQEYKERGH